MTYILIESTSFFSCKTSSNEGGAIYTGGGQSVFVVCVVMIVAQHTQVVLRIAILHTYQ
jgi:hypothetical protein